VHDIVKTLQDGQESVKEILVPEVLKRYELQAQQGRDRHLAFDG